MISSWCRKSEKKTGSEWSESLAAGPVPTRKVVLMEKNQEELKAHLIATNPEFRSLAEQHAEFESKLEAIESKPHVSIEDEDEEHRLKKQKLRLKDQMNAMLAQHRAEQVA